MNDCVNRSTEPGDPWLDHRLRKWAVRETTRNHRVHPLLMRNCDTRVRNGDQSVGAQGDTHFRRGRIDDFNLPTVDGGLRDLAVDDLANAASPDRIDDDSHISRTKLSPCRMEDRASGNCRGTKQGSTIRGDEINTNGGLSMRRPRSTRFIAMYYSIGSRSNGWTLDDKETSVQDGSRANAYATRRHSDLLALG